MALPHPHLSRRYWLFFGFTALVAVVLWGVYAKTMLLRSEPREKGPGLAVVERGPILDREGRLLAVSTKSETATLWRPQVKDLGALAATLSPLLGESSESLLNRMTTGPDFQYLKRKLSAKESLALREAKAKGLLDGVHFEPSPGRSYPEGDLAAGLIGYVGIDNVGLGGIEYSLNDVLAPEVSGASEQRTGASVWLTIDSVIQNAVQQLAEKAKLENKASRVNILVGEAQTGAIVAWASAPGFDPNRFASYSDDQRSNPILTRAYEPGSVFKVFSISTMLDAGAVHPSDRFNANGAYEHIVPATGEVIRIKDLGAYGWIDVRGILEYSSNAGTGYASDKIAADVFEQGLRRYGFGSPTGVPLSGETPGLLRPSSTWSARSKPTIAMGQEVGVSALQILQAASALANGGIMLKPQIVSRVVSDSGETLWETGRTEVRQVISASTADTVLTMLRSTVEEGTGRRAKVEGYDLAGKTGTAQVRDPQTGRYSDQNFLASFLLYLPADHPKYIIYLTIENPLGASYLGGQIAAPLGRQVAEKLIQLRGLPQKGESPVIHSGSASISPPQTLSVGDTMPNLVGLSKRSLLPLFNHKGLRIDVRGEGWVVRQTPEAGTPLTDDTRVVVELE